MRMGLFYKIKVEASHTKILLMRKWTRATAAADAHYEIDEVEYNIAELLTCAKAVTLRSGLSEKADLSSNLCNRVFIAIFCNFR